MKDPEFKSFSLKFILKEILQFFFPFLYGSDSWAVKHELLMGSVLRLVFVPEDQQLNGPAVELASLLLKCHCRQSLQPTVSDQLFLFWIFQKMKKTRHLMSAKSSRN